jgi:hypothetical protein
MKMLLQIVLVSPQLSMIQFAINQPRRMFRVLEGQVHCRLHAEEPVLGTV